ncbi:MAG: hypothetical protein ACK56I_33830, partial [bacterium]
WAARAAPQMAVTDRIAVGQPTCRRIPPSQSEVLSGCVDMVPPDELKERASRLQGDRGRNAWNPIL